jgi:hypothetical protein
MSSRAALRLAVVVLLFALCLQIGCSMLNASPTFDEPYHIVRSYVYLRTGDIALVARGGHPPFSNLLSVSPLLLRSDIVLPNHQPGWPDVRHFRDLFRVADEFFWRIGNDAEGIVLWSRLPNLLLSALLAGLVFFWARQMHGAWAGLLSLLLCCFDPNIIAHSSVVTTDLGGTFFVFLSVYLLWRFCKRPSQGRLVWVGAVFGLAQATKFSALFLAPVFVVLLVIWAFGEQRSLDGFSFPMLARWADKPQLQRAYLALGLCFAIFVIGSVVVWAVYGFQVTTLLPHEESHPLLDRMLPLSHSSVKRFVYAVAEGFPVPAPAYFADLAWLRQYTRAGHPSFLLGTRGVSGWWFYFPVALLIKTPIPLLLLLLAAGVRSLRRRDDRQGEYFLLVPMALFFVSSMFSSIDIGYRNILPVLPFVYVYAGKVVTLATARWARVVLLLLCAWYAVGTVVVAPHYLAYFNESIGGPANGYRYLVDSNLDWGQDLKNLKGYLDAHGIQEVYLDYFGTADPAYYGIRYSPLPDVPPGPEDATAYYAISATSLQNVYAQEGATSHWLAQFEPVDRVGYSIFVYRLP